MASFYNFTQEDLKKLLVNRFVVLIGDSVMRTIYKDLVVMLQHGRKLMASECKDKGEANFHNDILIEGGKMTNGKDYREVRQYSSPQHLIRFYFVTRIYNGYVETIFADFYKSLKPDVVIVNSCLWDISRYGVKSMESYKLNLQKFCCNLKRLLSTQAVAIWMTTLPVSSQIRSGFLSKGTGFLTEILRLDVLIANHFSYQVAKRFGFGVLDMHFLFRHKLHLLAKDGVHWMSGAHRDITNVLMGYICRALNIVIPNRCRVDRLLHYQQPSYNESLMSFEEPSSYCKADTETEMSYCEGLYDEAAYNSDNSFADSNWAGDSFNKNSWVGWPDRNYLTPDRNANRLQSYIGKWQLGPEGSSTPNLNHIRSRLTDQSTADWSSQSLNQSSRNAHLIPFNAECSDQYWCSTDQNPESRNVWSDGASGPASWNNPVVFRAPYTRDVANRMNFHTLIPASTDDSYLSFEEPPKQANYGESGQEIFPLGENFYKGNEVILSEKPKYLNEGQHEEYDHLVEQQCNSQLPLNNYSSFDENWEQTAEFMQNYSEPNRPPLNNSSFKKSWKPYQASEILRTQKSSMQNNRGKHVFTSSFNDVGNKLPAKRFHQPYDNHKFSLSQIVNAFNAVSRLIPQLQRITSARQNSSHSIQKSIYHHRVQPY